MDKQLIDKVTWHVRAAVEWGTSVLELFPALWKAAKTFAPLVVDFCDVCHKPITFLWIPVGDHDLCEKLEDPNDQDALYGYVSPLPPL